MTLSFKLSSYEGINLYKMRLNPCLSGNLSVESEFRLIITKFLREREYEALVQRLWDELRVMVPLETRYANFISAMCHPRN
jgi:hypothetical protein